MYFSHTPWLVQKLFPDIIWHISSQEKKLYLTFDDGPTPEITDWVLTTLSEYQAKATFFLVGRQIEKHPDLYKNILLHGHMAGNHTHTHLNGWSTSSDKYLTDVTLCSHALQTQHMIKTDRQSCPPNQLFRPPYGRLTLSQYRLLRIKNYQIIMWDILTGDFDKQLTGKACFDAYKKLIRPGSVIVFHDNIKALPRLRYCLPKTLEYFTAMGYTFESLGEHMARMHA